MLKYLKIIFYDKSNSITLLIIALLIDLYIINFNIKNYLIHFNFKKLHLSFK